MPYMMASQWYSLKIIRGVVVICAPYGLNMKFEIELVMNRKVQRGISHMDRVVFSLT